MLNQNLSHEYITNKPFSYHISEEISEKDIEKD